MSSNNVNEIDANLPWSSSTSIERSEGSLKLPFVRPLESERKFKSHIIEQKINEIKNKMHDKDLARIFENCFPNTLDTTIGWMDHSEKRPRTFIVTGDIPAMWLRDSTNQVFPYLRFAKNDPKLKKMLLGVIYMQADCILQHPYANAFHPPPGSIPRSDNPWSRVDSTIPETSTNIWEAKWEVDSLAAFLKISYNYWLYTDEKPYINDANWINAVNTVLGTIEVQRKGTLEEFKRPAYTFTRETRTSTETLMLDGRGAPVRRTGLVKSQFRPSDDASVFPFFIPGNAMLSVELAHLYELLIDTEHHMLAKKAALISQEIREAILTHGIVSHYHFGRILAYEIDGYGSMHLMDDANIPSLLSLPYIEFIPKEHELYKRTRNFVLSDYNKFFFACDKPKENVGPVEGVGGPHIGLGFIWPMSLCVKIITATDDKEILDTLEQLKKTTADTGLMHESFWWEKPSIYTRSWFAWANSLFGEMILRLAEEKPHLIFSEIKIEKKLIAAI
ncbi:3108_t:CDS:2 [Ambispora leptoticha]|uniref:3108_t:CDS:1 n=1 Tax=Ambispora leptoticha TaxID=144679 RepID=A0A9N8WBR4_9GLOM|nr:3108_t:CDS:2 [Ambispora leptoticha]